MSKLALRLGDPARSGVYWCAGDEEILDAARGTAIDVARVDLRAVKDKAGLMASFAGGLAFPRWFGANWDALADCLGDLSWRRGSAHVVLVEGASRLARGDLAALREALADAAVGWAERGKPFLAVFVGGRNPGGLPELFRRKA